MDPTTGAPTRISNVSPSNSKGKSKGKGKGEMNPTTDVSQVPSVIPSTSTIPSALPSISHAPTISQAPSEIPSISMLPSVSTAPSYIPSATKVSWSKEWEHSENGFESTKDAQKIIICCCSITSFHMSKQIKTWYLFFLIHKGQE